MKTIVSRGLHLVAGLVLAGAAAASEPTYGICRQQIADHVRQQLGQTVKRIDIRNYSERNRIVDHGDALAYVEECGGFHAFEVYGTWSTCEHIPHYGERKGRYVRYQGSYAGC